jgi:exopolyphosphatase/guanosine-5'-triphosphate,3'-diphosphate pyrophosphatase
MKLASIDIGSNAIRFQVVRVFETDALVSFKKLEYLRFPLRLGQDVFLKNKISEKTLTNFKKLMHAFKLLIDLYEVDGFHTVATSAMREAENGEAVRTMLKDDYGLEMDIISGGDEARILNKAIVPYLDLQHYYIHIDVGGGSTELNLFKGKELVASESFRLGSVRKLNRDDRTNAFKNVRQWIEDHRLHNIKNVVGIGTGGNINKLYKLANKANNLTISLAELKALKAYVHEFSFEERQTILKMNPDRADVIIPAAEIYIRVLEFIKSDNIMVPKVGLKDGLIYELYERVSGKSLSQIELIEEF